MPALSPEAIATTTTLAAPPPLAALPAAPRLWRRVASPPGVTVSGARWYEIDAPDDRKMLAAVFRPREAGPFPAVVFLHGTHGLRGHYLQAVKDLSENGFVVVVGGWFAGHYGDEEDDPVTYKDGITWPDGPALQPGTSPGSFYNILALVTAVRTLSSVRPDRVGLFGHSRGAVAALAFTFREERIRAVVAWAGFPPTGMITDIKTPVLMLQSTTDPYFPLSEAQAFERALRSAGYPVEAVYYEGASHYLYEVSPWREDAVARVRAFFQKHLAPQPGDEQQRLPPSPPPSFSSSFPGPPPPTLPYPYP